MTTEGATCSTALMTALDSSMRTSLTASPSGIVSVAPSSTRAGRSAFETATADSAPDTMPAMTAMRMMGSAPRRLRRGSV
ncbi:MAG: hypothetical protein ACRDM0_21040, partial [Thermoleophilaceae bacterium]